MIARHDECALRFMMIVPGYLFLTDTRLEKASNRVHQKRKGKLTRSWGQNRCWMAQKDPVVWCYQTEA